jgi:hypothetical protein
MALSAIRQRLCIAHQRHRTLDDTGSVTQHHVAHLLPSTFPAYPALLPRSGLGGVELFAMGLKSTGTYLSRTLSYKDAEFRLEQVEIAPPFRCFVMHSS